MSKPLRVLLVEDNPGDAFLICEQLGQVHTPELVMEQCDTLARALDRLRTGDVDLTLLDLTLPDSRGLETFAQLHAAHPGVPTVILTGLDDESLGVKAVSEGAQDYLVKGQVDARRLTRALRYALARSALQSRLQEESLNDELTGLYNRRGFMALARKQWKQTERAGKAFLLLFVDLDGLKAINDTQGHRAGDLAIQALAAAMRDTFRESDIVARLGGDEFLALAVDVPGGEVADVLTERLRKNLSRQGAARCASLELSASVGAVLCRPARDASLEALIERADAAMYQDKQRRRAGRRQAAGA
jgi:two-component system cell cycle response regulator